MTVSSAVQQIIDALPSAMPTNRRYVIALSGPPAAGKTTIAEQLRQALSPRAAVLGLDAFHFDNAVLNERNDLDRKGAPHTFDVAGYQRTLAHLRTASHESVAIPEFDRELELTRRAAVMVAPSHSILITEGNYLLLAEDPWSTLAPLFDLTVAVEASLDLISARIVERWRSYGFDDQTAQERLNGNDLQNAELTIARSRPADLTIEAADT